MSINQTIISGKLGADVTVRETNSGKSVASLRIATDDGYSKEGEWVSVTNWHDAVTFAPGLIEVLKRNATSGRLVTVIGSLSTRTYRKEGEDSDRRAVEIIIDKIDFPTRAPAQKEG